MKKLLLLLAVAAAVPAVAEMAAQEPDRGDQTREMKLIVRNRKGRVMSNPGLVIQLKGAREALQLDRSGHAVFQVTDADTLLMAGASNVYEFPLAGIDSLRVVLRNRSSVAGLLSGAGGPGSSGPGSLINVGYQTVSRRGYTGAISTLDMSGISGYSTLKDYIQGRVAGVSFMNGNQLVIRGIGSINSGIEALVVIDGTPVGSFAVANSSLHPSEVATITVLKDGGSTAIYGVRGANGVVLITTKKGNEGRTNR
jgi:TonB-dependent SusC/RagA subfamily outer membrane receptor